MPPQEAGHFPNRIAACRRRRDQLSPPSGASPQLLDGPKLVIMLNPKTKCGIHCGSVAPSLQTSVPIVLSLVVVLPPKARWFLGAPLWRTRPRHSLSPQALHVGAEELSHFRPSKSPVGLTRLPSETLPRIAFTHLDTAFRALRAVSRSVGYAVSLVFRIPPFPTPPLFGQARVAGISRSLATARIYCVFVSLSRKMPALRCLLRGLEIPFQSGRMGSCCLGALLLRFAFFERGSPSVLSVSRPRASPLVGRFRAARENQDLVGRAVGNLLGALGDRLALPPRAKIEQANTAPFPGVLFRLVRAYFPRLTLASREGERWHFPRFRIPVFAKREAVRCDGPIRSREYPAVLRVRRYDRFRFSEGRGFGSPELCYLSRNSPCWSRTYRRKRPHGRTLQ